MLIYQEFDTTPQNLIKDLRANVLLCTDWADISPTPFSTTVSGTLAVNATTVNVASTSGFSVGDVIVFEPGTANEERRAIATITSATQLTLGSGNGTIFAHASGSTVRHGRAVLKATTTRGVQMVVDLAGSIQTQQLTSLLPIFYRTHDGTVTGGVDPTVPRYVFFRSSSAGTASFNTMVIHCVVSASKEHLFLSVEGPRAWEANASSTTYGSQRQYLFMADLVPYHVADTTPVVVVGAGIANSASNSVATNSHVCFVSRNTGDSRSWTPGRLASLGVPNGASPDQPGLRRRCSIDGNTYLFPYVYFDDAEGIRGRLNNIYYAGSNFTTDVNQEPVNADDLATFDGKTFQTVAVDKGDGSGNASWGPLGISLNTSGNAFRSTMIGLPVA